MWKANLNRHFGKLFPALKISSFLILWSGLFHAFTLAILLFWSLTSNRVSSLNRMSTLNQFLSENQILFAALGSVSALLFFRDTLAGIWKSRRAGLPALGRSALRGAGFGGIMMTALIVNRDYELLGLSNQADLNFLTAYAWIFRAVLITVFVLSTEILVRVIIHRELPEGPVRPVFEIASLVLIYAVWFTPRPGELPTLVLLFSIFPSFWSAAGFLSSFFVLTHALLGLHFFENETTGLLQLKPLHSDETLLQNAHLQSMLVILFVLIRYAKLRLRKEALKS